jgi:excisionase family DNA binding protein
MTATAESQHDRMTAADDLISIAEAARRLGFHRDTLYRLARTGQFPPAVRLGSRWLVSVPRLDRFLHGDDGA